LLLEEIEEALDLIQAALEGIDRHTRERMRLLEKIRQLSGRARLEKMKELSELELCGMIRRGYITLIDGKGKSITN